MSLKAYEENDIMNIANAIRNKGQLGTFTVAQMADNINNIQSGGADLSNCLIWNQETNMPYIGGNYLVEQYDFSGKRFGNNHLYLSFNYGSLSYIFTKTEAREANSILDIKATRGVNYSVAALDAFQYCNFNYVKMNIVGFSNCTRFLNLATPYGVELTLHLDELSRLSLEGIGPTYARSFRLEGFPSSDNYRLNLKYSMSSSGQTNSLWVNLHNNSYANSINLNLRGTASGLNFYFGYSHDIDDSDVIGSFSGYPTYVNVVLNNLYVYNSLYRRIGNDSWTNEENLSTNIEFNFYNESFAVNETRNVSCVRRFYRGGISVYCTE